MSVCAEAKSGLCHQGGVEVVDYGLSYDGRFETGEVAQPMDGGMASDLNCGEWGER